MSLSDSQIAIIAVLMGVLYAFGQIMRDQTVPGLVGGALAGILTALVLKRLRDSRKR